MSTCTADVQSFQNLLCTAVFLLFTAICFFVCVHDRDDIINSHLTQIFMCATVNVKTMVLDFFYLRVSNYQLSSSPSDYKICYMFLCTSVYKISKLVHNTYSKLLSSCKSKNDHEFRICRFVHIIFIKPQQILRAHRKSYFFHFAYLRSMI